MNLKACKKCSVAKPLESFSKASKNKDGLFSICKDCNREYYLQNAERIKQRSLKWHFENKEKAHQRNKKWRESNPELHKQLNAKWREKNGDIHRANARRWAEQNNEQVKKNKIEWRSANRERLLEKDRERYAKNPEKAKLDAAVWKASNIEKARQFVRNWSALNADKVSAIAARRRAAKLRAIPSWRNEFLIAEIYHLAKLRTEITGFDWHVDHIVPLQGKMVCGLHVEHNLQVIPGSKNKSKSNRYWPDMP